MPSQAINNKEPSCITTSMYFRALLTLSHFAIFTGSDLFNKARAGKILNAAKKIMANVEMIKQISCTKLTVTSLEVNFVVRINPAMYTVINIMFNAL